MNDEAGFLRKLSETYQNIHTVNEHLSSLMQRSAEFKTQQSEKLMNEINKLNSSIATYYNTSLQNITSILSSIETILGSNPNVAGSTEDVLPDPSVIDGWLNQLFVEKIKTRNPPHQKYAGSHSHLFLNPSYGSYVCAIINNRFSLAIVTAFKDGDLYVIDPSTYSETDKQVYKLGPKDWVSMTIYVPTNAISRWEYPVKSQVLAMKRIDDVRWTLNFYKATVLRQPCELVAANEERGYILQYEDGSTAHVPEKFVATLIKDWAQNYGGVME